MRKFFIYIIGITISISLNAQKNQLPLLQNYIEDLIGQELFVQHHIDGSNIAENVSQVLAKNIIANYPTQTTLKLNYTRTSPSGIYYTYSLNYKNIAVYSTTLKVFVDKNNTIRWAHHNFTQYTTPNKSNFLTKTDVLRFAKSNYPNHQYLASESTWINNGETLIPSFAITLKNKKESTINQYVYSTDGELLYNNAIDKYITAADTPTYGYVYNPDPLTTAQTLYGGAYSDSTYKGTDSSTVDNPQLTAARRKVEFRAKLLGDSVILSNNDFFVQEVSAPSWPRTYVKLGDTFNFTRSQYQFADVNAFYHLNTQLKQVRKLGFNNLPGFRIQVDAHALNGYDESRFTAGDIPPSLQFGDGGIPDAEDAEVIVHEFGHALSYGASPGTAVGLQRRAMEEGLGDYFAVSYTWNLGTFNWEKVFSWDGNNGGWQGRTVDYKGSYTLLTNNIWTDGQLLSTAFMRLFRIIGKDKTDALMLEALYRLSSNMSMPQFANAVQQIDTLQNGGVNFEAIQCSFASVDILDSLGSCSILSAKKLTKRGTGNELYTLYNTWGFANNNGDAVVILNNNSVGYKLDIFSVTGNLVFSTNLINVETKIRGQNFAPGIYFLKVSDKQTGKTQTTKLLRY